MGDFNANISCTNVSHFGNMLNTFCNNEKLVIADQMFLDSEAFAFVSGAHNTCSWLDHVVITHTGCSIITSIEVIQDFVTSDYIHMYMELGFKCNEIVNNVGVKSKPKFD